MCQNIFLQKKDYWNRKLYLCLFLYAHFGSFGGRGRCYKRRKRSLNGCLKGSIKCLVTQKLQKKVHIMLKKSLILMGENPTKFFFWVTSHFDKGVVFHSMYILISLRAEHDLNKLIINSDCFAILQSILAIRIKLNVSYNLLADIIFNICRLKDIFSFR